VEQYGVRGKIPTEAHSLTHSLNSLTIIRMHGSAVVKVRQPAIVLSVSLAWCNRTHRTLHAVRRRERQSSVGEPARVSASGLLLPLLPHRPQHHAPSRPTRPRRFHGEPLSAAPQSGVVALPSKACCHVAKPRTAAAQPQSAKPKGANASHRRAMKSNFVNPALDGTDVSILVFFCLFFLIVLNTVRPRGPHRQDRIMAAADASCA